MKGKFIPMLIRRVVELFTPSPCLGCGAEGASLCSECVMRAVQTRPVMCFRCHRVNDGGQTCETCRLHTPLSGVVVGARYEGAVKELVLQLKFHRLRSAAEAAAELILAGLPENLRAEMLTSVPISPARYRERGYNQSALVARQVAQRLGLRYAPLLGRVTSTHQMGQDRSARLAQIKGAFYPLRTLEGRSVLVVDDVITTGATLSECAETLRAVGAGEVWGAAAARH